MPGVPGRALRYVAILTGLVAFAAARPQPSAPPRAVANDNRVPAGIRSHDTPVLRLVVQRADWYSEAETGSYLTVEAFGEEGKPAGEARTPSPGPAWQRCRMQRNPFLGDRSKGSPCVMFLSM